MKSSVALRRDLRRAVGASRSWPSLRSASGHRSNRHAATALFLARARLSRLARHGRDPAALDADRRQGPARADALAQPRLARAALRHRARPRHVGDPRRDGELLEIEFDFVDHRLVVRTSNGAASAASRSRRCRWPTSIAESSPSSRPRASTSRSNRVPNEVADPIPFADDTRARRLRRARRRTRSGARWSRSTACCSLSARGFLGKASPVHFFWGSFDLAVTRFSGRPAPLHPGGIPRPARRGDARGLFARGQQRRLLARQRRLSAGRLLLVRLSRAARLRRSRIEPEGARWSKELGEWLLPYEAVRTAADPDAAAAALPRIDLSRRRRPRRAGIRPSTARSACRAGRDRSAEPLAATRGASRRRQRAQPEAQLRHLDVALGVEIAALPLVGIASTASSRRASAPALHDPAPREVVVDVEHVRRVRLGQRRAGRAR